MDSTPVFKDIILVGGGHAHALVIKQWGMNPLPGVRLTLISPQAQTPYSGMLPGLIAGHYSVDQIHIDLAKICQWAGVRFIRASVSDINPEQQSLVLAKHPNLYYDLLSVDIGSTPNHSIPGVKDYASPIKPISGFYQHWKNTLKNLRKSKGKTYIAVVGGGAGSVETILAMAWAVKNDALIKDEVEFKLVYRGASILSSYSSSVIKKVEKACAKLNVCLQSHFSVKTVTESLLLAEDGKQLEFNELFWCTQASAPHWLAKTGIACDDEGFIKVNEYLQSVNYPTVFAAGDIAYMEANPRPKAGVYAVRQAPFLFRNLSRKLLNKRLQAYKPQDKFLGLLSLGDKTAVGTRAPYPAFSGAWVWRWKDRIDQKFMNVFQGLNDQAMTLKENIVDQRLIPLAEHGEKLQAKERCGGCGAKIGAGILSTVLTELMGSYEPEDATTIPWVDETLIQTIDHIKAPFDDPYLFGRIAVFHALSDLFAMNAKAHSIHISVTLPFAGRDIQTRELRLLLQGVLSACDELKVELLGGHSSEGSELSLAISANGQAGETRFKKQRLRAGDLLVLSKPLGTGLILAGQMQLKTNGKDLAVALDSMNQSNQAMALTLSRLGVQCCTDVTGFGLLGHLSEMLQGEKLQVELYMNQLSCLPGALALAKEGVRSSLHLQNELNLSNAALWLYLKESAYWPVLLDPQTSGGLLAAIRPEQEQAAREAGLSIIGRLS